MNPVLEVRDITKTFVTEGKSDFTAVSHVSFLLYPGEILGIVGESGSGKSTLARIIARLTDATEGRILLENQDITRAKGEELRAAYREIQMVFQNPVSSFDPRKTLGNGIGESLRNHGVSKAETKERVLELLEQCGLPKEFYGRYPHEVSGGQCQRAAIARALAVSPSVLICDEATSSLDVTVQKQVLNLLQELKEKEGLSLLMISHDLALVQAFCDEVLVLYQGKAVEMGTPDEIINHPSSEYTRILMDSVL